MKKSVIRILDTYGTVAWKGRIATRPETAEAEDGYEFVHHTLGLSGPEAWSAVPLA